MAKMKMGGTMPAMPKATALPGGSPSHGPGKPHLRMRKMATVPKTAFPNAGPTAFNPGPMAGPDAGMAGPAPMDAGPGALGQ